MKPLLLTVGNIYIDHNIFGIHAGHAEQFTLVSGKDYHGSRSERVLGGSAVNAAMQAMKLGIQVGFIGKTGDDEGGQQVRKLLDDEGILSELVGQDANLATSMAINMVDNNGQFIGVHHGEASKHLAISDIDLENDLFSRCKAIYFGGTAKQPLLLRDGEKLFSALNSKDIPIFYDPNRFPVQEEMTDRNLILSQLAFTRGYFPNEEELAQLTGAQSVDEALSAVLNTGVGFVALKLGEKGCRIKTKDDDFRIGGYKITPLTTVGAGDCFNATFIAYFMKGLTLHECAERATAAAAIKVSKNEWPDEYAINQLITSGTA